MKKDSFLAYSLDGRRDLLMPRKTVPSVRYWFVLQRDGRDKTRP